MKVYITGDSQSPNKVITIINTQDSNLILWKKEVKKVDVDNKYTLTNNQSLHDTTLIKNCIYIKSESVIQILIYDQNNKAWKLAF